MSDTTLFPTYPTFIKGPGTGEVLDYTEDFTGPLSTDTITGTPVWTVSPSGDVTVASQSNTTTKATARLTGGVRGKDYVVSCKATGVSGQAYKRSILIKVRDR